MKQETRYAVIVATLAVFTGHALAASFGWYEKIPHFDSVMHVIGGWWVSVILLFLADTYPSLSPFGSSPRLVRTLTLVAFVTLVGVVWEFFEFGVDFLPGMVGGASYIPHQTYSDTLHDLFFALIGALLTACIFGSSRDVRNSPRTNT